MSILVDLIIIGLFILFIFLGYKRGLIGVAFKICSFLIAIVVSFVFFKPVSNYIVAHTQLDDSLQSSIEQMIKGNDSGSVDTQKMENSPNVLSDYINSAVESATKSAKTNIAEAVSREFAITIINAGVLISLFILTKIVLFFLRGLFDALANLPIVKQFNEFGGTIYGILEGLLFIFIILGIISFFIPYPPIRNAIHQSILGNFLYNNNILLMLFF